MVPSDPLVVVVGLAQAVLAPPNARAMAPASTVLRMSNSLVPLKIDRFGIGTFSQLTVVLRKIGASPHL
jgi:hypothetical protein